MRSTLARPSTSVTTVQVATTTSGAVYVHTGAVLLRFKGYGVHAYNLESGQPIWTEGKEINALVLPEGGKGVGRVSSTRITKTWLAEAAQVSAVMPEQFTQMARTALALARVGHVDLSAPSLVDINDLRAKVQEARNGAKRGEPGYRPAQIFAPCVKGSHKPGCRCTSSTDCCEGTPVSHNGSRMCQSGSIASGGNRAHCTCDRCF